MLPRAAGHGGRFARLEPGRVRESVRLRDGVSGLRLASLAWLRRWLSMRQRVRASVSVGGQNVRHGVGVGMGQGLRDLGRGYADRNREDGRRSEQDAQHSLRGLVAAYNLGCVRESRKLLDVRVLR